MSASSTRPFCLNYFFTIIWHNHNGEKSETEKMMREVDEKLSIKELGPDVNYSSDVPP